MATMLEDWPRRRLAETADSDPAISALETDVLDELEWLDEEEWAREAATRRPGAVSAGTMVISGAHDPITIRWGHWTPRSGYAWSRLLNHKNRYVRRKVINWRSKEGKKELGKLLINAREPEMRPFFDWSGKSHLYRIFRTNVGESPIYIGETRRAPFVRLEEHLSEVSEQPYIAQMEEESRVKRYIRTLKQPRQIKVQIKRIESVNSDLDLARKLAEQYHIFVERPKLR